MKIGIFDSGIGGEAIAQALAETFPRADIITVNDNRNLPYGDKTPDEVKSFTDTAIQSILGRDIIVIACNTATTLALSYLRQKYPHQKFIGIEPMIKPASKLTRSGVICVCATPATLASERYLELKRNYASSLIVVEPDCSKWASMIENNSVNKFHIHETITPALEQGTDIIVLGCTHYHWIKEMIQNIAGDNATILEPSESIARRVEQLLTPL